MPVAKRIFRSIIAEQDFVRGDTTMAAFFQSLPKTLAAGVVLLIVIVILVGLIGGHFIKIDHAYGLFFMRWLHIMSGVMWVGLLLYLNFVQTPTVPKIEPAEHRAAITKFIAPNVLFWFRYSALVTVIFGLTLALMKGYLIQALTFQRPNVAIGIGMWLALVMAFNVWFIIWPNQKKVLGLVEASADEKAASARLAGMTSRINTMLSIPMLYCMVAQQNQAGL
jgi:uncharacterized membrane protein